MPTEAERQFNRANGRVVLFKAATSGVRLSIERKYQQDVTGILGRWYKRISRLLVTSGTLRALQPQARLVKNSSLSEQEKLDAANILIRAATLRLDDIVPQMPERRDLQTIMEFRNLQGYNLGAITGLRAMGFKARSPFLDRTVSKAEETQSVVVFGLTDQELISTLLERPVLVGASTSAVTIENSRRMIRDKMFVGPGSLDETARAIARAEGIREWQGLRIARTEMQVAVNTSLNNMYSRSGVPRKGWLTVGDNRVRPAHTLNELDGWIPITKPFSSGQMHPGDGAQSINCRCSLEGDLSDPSILLEPWNGSGGFHLNTVVAGAAGGL